MQRWRRAQARAESSPSDSSGSPFDRVAAAFEAHGIRLVELPRGGLLRLLRALLVARGAASAADHRSGGGPPARIAVCYSRDDCAPDSPSCGAARDLS